MCCVCLVMRMPVSAGLAWLVIPGTRVYFSVGSLDFQSWRLFVVLCSIPSLTSALIFRLFMPESPKFLIEVFKSQTSVDICKLLFLLSSVKLLSPSSGCQGRRSHPRLSDDVSAEHVGERKRLPGMNRIMFFVHHYTKP